MHPDWAYHCWDDQDNADLIQAHFPQHAEAYAVIKKGVIKADIARYAYMYVHGGVYLDTDYKLLRPLTDGILDHEAILPLERGDLLSSGDTAEIDPTRSHLGNAILASRPAYPLWADFIDHLFNAVLPALSADSDVVKLSGPVGLTTFWYPRRDTYSGCLVPNRNLFYPEIFNFAMRTSALPETYGVHLVVREEPLIRWPGMPEPAGWLRSERSRMRTAKA